MPKRRYVRKGGCKITNSLKNMGERCGVMLWDPEEMKQIWKDFLKYERALQKDPRVTGTGKGRRKSG